MFRELTPAEGGRFLNSRTKSTDPKRCERRLLNERRMIDDEDAHNPFSAYPQVGRGESHAARFHDRTSGYMASTDPGGGQAGRTVLPIPEPKRPAITELDARKATPPPRFEVKAPAGAPNVLIILIDDMGFGMSSAFGGPIHMPTVERLADNGLRYNHFHTTALCSPTRTALLSGRNHHMNNMGGITEIATGFPGNTGQRPNNVAPLAEMLRLNGYSTSFFGKNHETAAWEVSPSGPTDRWPTRSGFDKFYGFIGGETNQWAPLLYDGLTQIETAEGSELSFHDRHDQPGDPLDALPEIAHAGQAVLYVFCPRRYARAPSCAEGMDRQVQGPVRWRVGQVPRRDVGSADQTGRGASGDCTRAQTGSHQGLGQALG